MAIGLEQFIKQLVDSGIIAQGKLAEFIPPKAEPKDAQELARLLVQQRQLTKFQAQEIYQGRVDSLILGNYTILDRIGAGGMGQVFKAEHRRMKRVVALKTLPPAVSNDPLTLARFQREVEAAARLSHPSIVAAYDADEAGGVHFLVMEYVEGSDLSSLVKKQGPLSESKAVSYLAQAAKGLQFAHEQGVVHRDIKPANLLVDKAGSVKILDMGLARIESDGDVGAQADLTGTGAVMGTVDYMAPEQAMSTRRADARADIYSLGCTFHYLLTGKPIYDGETLMARLVAHREEPVPTLPGQAEGSELQAVFARMVAKRVEDRYQTMRDVATALDGLGSGDATSLGVRQSQVGYSGSDVLTFLKNVPLQTSHKTPAAPGSPAGKRSGWLVWGVLGATALSAALAVGLYLKLTGQTTTPLAAEPLIPPGEGGRRPDEGGSKAVPRSSAAGRRPNPLPKGEGARPPAPLVAPFDAKAARAGQEAWATHLNTTVEQKNSIGMTLVLIPPGEFRMGSTPEQNAAGLKMAEDTKLKPDLADVARRLKEEVPLHRVALTRPYLLGSTEVTIGQFKTFVEATKYITEAEQYGFGNSRDTALTDKIPPELKKMTWRAPGYAVTDDSPVTQVTWNDAAMFCNWLSDQEELNACYRQDGSEWILLGAANGYRLPTEAEWEYACRAGTTTQFWFGDDVAELEQHDWHNKNAGGRARAIGLKSPNPFGLYDMHGNVREWLSDYYDGKYYEKSPANNPFCASVGSTRVSRGGYWSGSPVYCRSACRVVSEPAVRSYSLGFRVSRLR